MVASRSEDTPKLSRIEILGAWLGVWTPPRDAVVPPVPWRRIGQWALAVAVVLGAGLAIAVPAIDRSKDARAEREQRALDERAAVRRRVQRAEERPRFGRVPGAERRADVVAVVEAAIGRDARARFSPRARPATCEPIAGADVAARRVAYDCYSAVRDIVGGRGEGVRGTLAIPFRAVLDFRDGSYAFCKVNPVPGEQVVPDPRRLVELPRACRTPGRR